MSFSNSEMQCKKKTVQKFLTNEENLQHQSPCFCFQFTIMLFLIWVTIITSWSGLWLRLLAQCWSSFNKKFGPTQLDKQLKKNAVSFMEKWYICIRTKWRGWALVSTNFIAFRLWTEDGCWKEADRRKVWSEVWRLGSGSHHLRHSLWSLAWADPPEEVN